MKRFQSRVDVQSKDFLENRRSNLELAEILAERQSAWSRQGPPSRIRKARREGKLLGRERLQLILDQDSPFLEIMPLRGWEDPSWTPEPAAPAAGGEEEKDRKGGQRKQKRRRKALQGSPMVGGIGLIGGVLCVVVAWIPTSDASIGRITGSKWQRCSDISIANRLPFVQLLESGGADLDDAFEVFHSTPNAFKKMAERSGKLIPTVTVVVGGFGRTLPI